MLPPQLRSGIPSGRPRILSMSKSSSRLPPLIHSRHFWFCRKSRPADYLSQADPLYNRINRFRTLKTRAQLLKSLRRRSKWDWDLEHTPFFTSKHIRFASHWYGGSSPSRWQSANRDDPDNANKDRALEADTDGYDLSPREKEWKQQMEAMRKRIDADPYEAVFGKRFEPFWHPLLSSWLKDDIAPDGSKTSVEAEKKTIESEARHADQPVTPEAPKARPAVESYPDTYAYKSSTTWNSWTNKTRRTEWDSRSGQMRRWEYDPVSNRMVQIEGMTIPDSKLEAAKPTQNTNGIVPQPAKAAPDAPLIPTEATSTPSTGSPTSSTQPEKGLESLTADGIRAAMRRTKETISMDGDRVFTSFPSLLSQPAKPATALQTAFDRSVDKVKTTTTSVLEPAIARAQSKKGPKIVDLDDAAAHESIEPIESPANIPKAWREQADLLQADRVSRTAAKVPYPKSVRWIDDMQAKKAAYEAEHASQASTDPAEAQKTAKLAQTNKMLEEEISQQKMAMQQHEDRYAHKIKSLRGELETAYKQSSLNADDYRDQINKLETRIRSFEQAADAVKIQDVEKRYKGKVVALRKELDTAYKQSSAHADEFLDRIRKLEAELQKLQKAAGEGSPPVYRSGNHLGNDGETLPGEGDMCVNVSQFAQNGRWYKQPNAIPKRLKATSTKSQQMLEDAKLIREVRSIYEQRYGIIGTEGQTREAAVQETGSQLDDTLKRNERQGTYVFKDDGLEEEIKNREKDASAEQSVTFPSAKNGKAVSVPPRRESSVKGDQTKTTSGSQKSIAESHVGILPELVSGEAKDAYTFRDDGWGKKVEPAAQSQSGLFPPEKKDAYIFSKDIEPKPKEYGLTDPVPNLAAKEKRNAYIFQNHAGSKQKADLTENAIPEISSREKKDAYIFKGRNEPEKLEAEGAEQSPKTLEHEKKDAYIFRNDDLEAQIQSQEREVHDAQVFEVLNSPLKSRKVAAGSFLNEDVDTKSPTTIDDSASAHTTSSVQWHQPPLYKIVAYDSGNDLFSTSNTTSNVISQEAETPISIADVLDRLSQPAKFVPQFARLQKEGYQAVFASRDVLVCRKVAVSEKDSHDPKSGVFAPEYARSASAARQSTTINPVDKTGSLRVSTERFASPTGFVNHDPVIVPDAVEQHGEQGAGNINGFSASSHQQSDSLHDIDRDRLFMKRQEDVFSGTLRAGSHKTMSKRQQRRERDRARRDQDGWSHGYGWKRSFRRGLLVGTVGVFGTAYLIGSAIEPSRENMQEKRLSQGMSEAEKRRFQDVLEGKK